MRLADITGIDKANKWLGGLIEDYNRRFAKPAKRHQNVHRPVYETQNELYDIFSWQLTRQVSNALTLQYDRVKYMLSNTSGNEHLTGQNVMIYDYPDGNIDIKYLGKSLEFTAFDHLEVIRQGDVVENKRLREVLKFAMTEQERLENEGLRERGRADGPRRQAQHRQVRINLAVLNSMKEEMVT
ncbi:hypothetical protein VUK15_21985 (plasmid) [Photobacterium damselae subsp. piscicida]